MMQQIQKLKTMNPVKKENLHLPLAFFLQHQFKSFGQKIIPTKNQKKMEISTIFDNPKLFS